MALTMCINFKGYLSYLADGHRHCSGVARKKEPVSRGSGGRQPPWSWRCFLAEDGKNSCLVTAPSCFRCIITGEWKRLKVSFGWFFLFVCFLVFKILLIWKMYNIFAIPIHWYNDPVELRLHGTRKKTIKREE